MKKKSLKLKELQIKSFITTLDGEDTPTIVGASISARVIKVIKIILGPDTKPNGDVQIKKIIDTLNIQKCYSRTVPNPAKCWLTSELYPEGKCPHK